MHALDPRLSALRQPTKPSGGMSAVSSDPPSQKWARGWGVNSRICLHTRQREAPLRGRERECSAPDVYIHSHGHRSDRDVQHGGGSRCWLGAIRCRSTPCGQELKVGAWGSVVVCRCGCQITAVPLVVRYNVRFSKRTTVSGTLSRRMVIVQARRGQSATRSTAIRR